MAQYSKVVTVTLEFTLAGRVARHDRLTTAYEAAVEAATDAFQEALLEGSVEATWSAMRYDYRHIDIFPMAAGHGDGDAAESSDEDEVFDEFDDQVDQTDWLEDESGMDKDSVGTSLDRWAGGWVSWNSSQRPQPPNGGGFAHRRNPDSRNRTMCGLPIARGTDSADVRPVGYPACDDCAAAVGRARRNAVPSLRGFGDSSGRSARPRRREAVFEEVGRRFDPDLKSEVSVRAYSGGLPGLGKRA